MQNDKQKKDGTDALVRHVVRSSPMPEPPADFADNVAGDIHVCDSNGNGTDINVSTGGSVTSQESASC